MKLKNKLSTTFKLLIFISAFAHSAFGQFGITMKKIDNPLLADLLTISQSKEIISYEQLKSCFGARLFSLSKEGDCVEGTHSVCSSDYYLALFEYGDPGAKAVYSMGNFWEIDVTETRLGETCDDVLIILEVWDLPPSIKERKSKFRRMKISLSVDNTQSIFKFDVEDF